MEKNWIKIFETGDFFRAEMIRQALAEHEIDAVIINKQDSIVHMGPVELFTHENEAAAAQQVIEEMTEEI
ncbi:Putative signal transducing protein [bacterium A37T11]|nr:Putative signal transducing protein [bacterium A37T11]